MQSKTIFFLTTILCLFSINALCQSKGNSMITIPGEDKIRHSTVNNFAMTSDGTLWMCTEEGLISFDGVHSMFVKVEDTDAVAKNIKSLIEMPGGRFLIGSNEGLFLKYRDESQEESNGSFRIRYRKCWQWHECLTGIYVWLRRRVFSS